MASTILVIFRSSAKGANFSQPISNFIHFFTDDFVNREKRL